MARSVAIVLWSWVFLAALFMLLAIARGEWIAHRERRATERQR